MTLKNDLLLIVRQSRTIALFTVLVALPCLYLLSGFYSVGAEERGIVTRFGRIVQDNVMPGMNYHLPWPIESAQTLSVTALRSMDIDFTASAPEQLQPELTTGDEDLVDVAIQIQYNISEPALFASTTAAEVLLQQLAMAETLYYISANAIDQLLTTGRTSLQNHLRSNIQHAASDLQLGVRITSVQIRRLEPPASIKKAFDDVARASSEKQKMIQDSMGERGTRLAEARSAANRVRQQAAAYATTVLERAQGDRDYFFATWQEYKKAPNLEAQRLYLEKLERIMAPAQISVVQPAH